MVDHESRSIRNCVGSSKRSYLVTQFSEMVNREPLIEEHADAMVASQFSRTRIRIRNHHVII